MPDSSRRLSETLKKRRSVGVLERCSAYIRTLSPGDQFIAGVLGVILAGTSLLGLYALERSFLVVEPAYGGTLHEGVAGSPRFVNPLLALSDADRDITALTYAGLMGQGPDGTLVPVLASSYQVSPDGKVYTFTLRSNAKFSDGSPVTADDIVFTVTKAQDPGLKSPEMSNWANIRVEAVDARTVRFSLPRAYAPFLEDTTLGILPARLWRNIADEDFPFTTLATSPVGAGPFKVDRIKRDKTGLITGYDLVYNRDYVLGRPYLDGIRFTFFDTEEDVAAALAAHRIESAYGIARPDARTAPYARIFAVFFNGNDNPAFAHAEVRKALSMAIDRERLVSGLLGGFATPVAGPVPPGSGIATPPVITASDRIKAAAKVLTDAGWTYDTDARAWKKKSETLAVTLKTSNVPELKSIASAVRDDWAELGVSTDLELYEPGDLVANVIRPRSYGALLFGEVIGRSRDLFAFWHSSEMKSPGLNIALYSDKTVDALLEKARAESDAKAVSADLARINDRIAAAYPAAFLYAPDFLYVVPSDLHGVVLSQIASPSDRFDSAASWYRRTEAVWPFFARK